MECNNRRATAEVKIYKIKSSYIVNRDKEPAYTVNILYRGVFSFFFPVFEISKILQNIRLRCLRERKTFDV